MNNQPDSLKAKAILDAAQRRFAYYGISKVTMDEIATDVGLSKAALYYYFDDKEELFREVVAREQREFIQQMEIILEKDISSTEKFQAYILQQLKLLNELINLKKVNNTGNAGQPVLSDLFQEFAKEEHRLMKEIIVQGKDSGEFPMDVPEKSAELIVNILQGLRLLSYKKYLGKPDTQTFHRMETKFKLLTQTILYGMITEKTNA